MTDNGDEERERQRQARERALLPPEDRLLGEIKRTKSGGLDHRSKGKRKYRVVMLPLRVRLLVSAMIDHIIERDHHPSRVELFEVMLEAYLEKYGQIDMSLLPSEDELVSDYLKQQDDDDAK